MKILLVSKLHLLFRIARNKSGDGCNEMVTKFKYLGIGFSKDFFFSLIYLVLSLFQQVACSRTLLKFQKKKKIAFGLLPKVFRARVHVYSCIYVPIHTLLVLYIWEGEEVLPRYQHQKKFQKDIVLDKPVQPLVICDMKQRMSNS